MYCYSTSEGVWYVGYSSNFDLRARNHREKYGTHLSFFYHVMGERSAQVRPSLCFDLEKSWMDALEGAGMILLNEKR